MKLLRVRNAVCIKRGCGKVFDASKSEKRPYETLRPFWTRYCPEHRPADKPQVIIEGSPHV